MNLRVVNDMMVVRAWGGSQAWVSDQISTGLQDEAVVKQEKLAELRKRTGLNAAFAELCLNENNWDLNNALSAFERAKVSLYPFRISHNSS